jgi:prephenate dehydrogenase
LKIEFDIRRAAVIGVGLIGGSFALALRKAYPDVVVVGFDPNPAALSVALSHHAIDHAAAGCAEAIAAAELIFIATPVGVISDVFAAVAPSLGTDALVVDGCSTKESPVAAARLQLGGALSRYVPSHPIAGSERRGLGAARADLFRDRPVVLTPLSDTSSDALSRVSAMWRALGAVPHEMTPNAHDELFAYLSHAPHLLAFAWMDLASANPGFSQALELAGSGFRDFTRIAASDPSLWTEIVLDNRAAIEPLLAQHVESLNRLRLALSTEDTGEVQRLFERAAKTRRSLA